MRQRKSIAYLTVLALVLCITGCSGQNRTTKDKEVSDKSAKVIQIKKWDSGISTDVLNKLIQGFEKKHPQYRVEVESSPSSTELVRNLGLSDIDDTDLYFCVKDYNADGYLEPLNDIVDSKAEGDSKTIREKLNQDYIKMETSKDGNIYNLTYRGSIVGIFYNKDIFEEQEIKQLPRTTKELLTVCDTLYSANVPAFSTFEGYWEDSMSQAFFVQYDGLDYVLNKFYGCVDEAGESPSLNVFTKKDGRYEAMKVIASVLTPEYTNTTGEGAMEITGTWCRSDEYFLMRTPVVSSIVDKLTTVKTEAQLRKIISAIDSVTDEEKDIASYREGENYLVDGITVSASDWSYIQAARNTMASNDTGNSAYIPNYSDNIQGAKEFLRYMYSDEGYTIYANAIEEVFPMSLSKGELDKSEWSEQAQQKAHIYETTEQIISIYNASAHDIFKYGGATWKGDIRIFSDKFHVNDSNTRWTAEDAWQHMLQYANTNYESAWIASIQ